MKLQLAATALGTMALSLSPFNVDASREKRLKRRTLQQSGGSISDPFNKVEDSNDNENYNRATDDQLKEAAAEAAANRAPPGRESPMCSKKSKKKCKFGPEGIPYPFQGGGGGMRMMMRAMPRFPTNVVVPLNYYYYMDPLPPVCGDGEDQYPCDDDSEYPDVSINICEPSGSSSDVPAMMMSEGGMRRLSHSKNCVKTKSEEDLECNCQAHFVQGDNAHEVANQCVGLGGHGSAWIEPYQMMRPIYEIDTELNSEEDMITDFLDSAQMASLQKLMPQTTISGLQMQASDTLKILSQQRTGMESALTDNLSFLNAEMSKEFTLIGGDFSRMLKIGGLPPIPEELCTIVEWIYYVLGPLTKNLSTNVTIRRQEIEVIASRQDSLRFVEQQGLYYTGMFFNGGGFAGMGDLIEYIGPILGLIESLYYQCGSGTMRGERSTLYCCDNDCKDVKDCRFAGTRNSCQDDIFGVTLGMGGGPNCMADTCDVKYEMEVVTSTVTLFDGCIESAIYCCPREVPVQCPRGTIPNPCLDPSSLDNSGCDCKGGPVTNVFYPYFTPDYSFGGMMMSMGPDQFTCSELPFSDIPGCGPPTASSCVPDPCGRREGYGGGAVTSAYSTLDGDSANYFEGKLFCGMTMATTDCMDYCMMAPMRRGRMLEAGGMPAKAPPLPDSYEINPALSNVDVEKASLSTLSDALKCDAIANENRPIHTASKFRALRQTYEDVVGSKRSSITQLFKDQCDFEDAPISAGENDQLRIEEILGRGRGIVASKDIKKGEKLWSDIHLAEFYNIEDLRRFLSVLPVEMACDIVLWTYSFHETTESFYFSVDLDLSTFCNDGRYSGTNVEWIHGTHFDTATAARDIAAGEEVLCNYKA